MPAEMGIEDLGGFKIAVDADDCDVSRQVREELRGLWERRSVQVTPPLRPPAP
jgi:hypothetical protein